MAIKFNELMKNYEKFFDEVSTLKNKELVEFDRYLYLFDKLIDTDSSFAKLYHKIDDEVAGLDSDKKILAFMFALDELGHIDVSHATFNESKKSARRSLKESAETIFDFCEDMNKMWKNYDVEFIANDGVEDSVTVLIGTNHPKMVAEYIYANHFRGVKYANVGVEKNKAMLIFYHFSEHSSNEIERLAFDAITDANIRYNLFEKSRKSARKNLKEKGLRYGVDTLELIQDDIEQYIQDNDLDIQIVDNGFTKAMDVMYIYDCKGKDMKKLKSGDLMDYLFSENGMLFHNLDFDVKVSSNQITINLPKTQDYVE